MSMGVDKSETSDWEAGKAGKIQCCSLDFKIYRAGQEVGNSGIRRCCNFEMKVVGQPRKLEMQISMSLS